MALDHGADPDRLPPYMYMCMYAVSAARVVSVTMYLELAIAGTRAAAPAGGAAGVVRTGLRGLPSAVRSAVRAVLG